MAFALLEKQNKKYHLYLETLWPVTKFHMYSVFVYRSKSCAVIPPTTITY